MESLKKRRGNPASTNNFNGCLPLNPPHRGGIGEPTTLKLYELDKLYELFEFAQAGWTCVHHFFWNTFGEHFEVFHIASS